jgi:hypothetical protein
MKYKPRRDIQVAAFYSSAIIKVLKGVQYFTGIYAWEQIQDPAPGEALQLLHKVLQLDSEQLQCLHSKLKDHLGMSALDARLTETNSDHSSITQCDSVQQYFQRLQIPLPPQSP